MKGGSQEALIKSKRAFSVLAFFAFFVLPPLWVFHRDVNMLGRYMAFAILALGLDLLWGYVGILSLCQFTFFCLGAYAMGMHLAHHGGPEGIIDAEGWKIPACLFVVYPYEVGEASGDALVPGFWKPFWNLPLTVLLGLAIPGLVSFALGYLVFRSRVRGVYFAILTQAIAVASWLVFCRNDVKLCGTNGLTRFDVIAPKESITTFNPVDAKDQWLASHGNSMEYDLNKDGKLDQLDYSVAEVGFSFFRGSPACPLFHYGDLPFRGIPTLQMDREFPAWKDSRGYSRRRAHPPFFRIQTACFQNFRFLHCCRACGACGDALRAPDENRHPIQHGSLPVALGGRLGGRRRPGPPYWGGSRGTGGQPALQLPNLRTRLRFVCLEPRLLAHPARTSFLGRGSFPAQGTGAAWATIFQ